MSTVRALLIFFTVTLCAIPALGGAEPRPTSPPAPETTSTPATGAPSEAATPPVAPAPPLVEAPAAQRAAEQSGAGVLGARSEALDVGWAATRLALACAAVGVLLIGGLKLYRRSLQPGRRAAGRRSGGWLARWGPAKAVDTDRISLLARSYLGTRESVCVLRVGTERFLVGVTSAQISMLGRLGSGESTEAMPAAHERRRGSVRAGAAAPRPAIEVAADVASHSFDSLGSPACGGPGSAVPGGPSGFFSLGSPPAAPRTATPPDFAESLMAAASARDGGGDAELRQALARSRARLAEIVSGRSSSA